MANVPPRDRWTPELQRQVEQALLMARNTVKALEDLRLAIAELEA